jgi:hypothetical protein
MFLFSTLKLAGQVDIAFRSTRAEALPLYLLQADFYTRLLKFASE